ncbi:glycoside hydrolase family 32 protein [Algoriphagus sp. CAU 1675]|uniref:glycoside hydrolase family 32 protein n=1 Tax=Algoriphagus sp. CAU 1675 TaxID=3032597 RepID=UPI0023DCDB14|nr:glycoside hydrolase family 32 protein [Algoriphagus sp. CAU 1675]MDF2157868.1 glycoside hydrolase family 32 protein [Algoriphagus sp. CAU 1675]
MIRFQFLVFAIAIVFSSCQKEKEIIFRESGLEKYRPLIHFTPPFGWMNDPNGLIYKDGIYHLFYQHYPDSIEWGPMHWGHATSKNLTKWEHQPIALYPDSLGYIFSGSVIYDQENSSGLGTLELPPLVAIYTYHNMEGEKSGKLDFQFQGIAYSSDNGKTWHKYKGNPVLPNQGVKDFRDPKVTQVVKENGEKIWVMTLAVWDRVHFYSSKNLIDWDFLGQFGQNNGAHGGVWECPDLFQLVAPDGSEKWVLITSINPGGPQKGSATQYFIGDFQNGQFIPDDNMIRWLDYGPDNYAGVTFSNLPKNSNRTLFIGWMSNWLYAQVVPTKSWRSSMTLPRELSLFEVEGTKLIQSKPASELKDLRKEEFKIKKNQSGLPSQAVEILASVQNNEDFNIVLSNENGEQVSIFKEMGLISIDRTQSGSHEFHPDFLAMHSAPMSWSAKNIRIYLDSNSIELFINDGELVMTSLLFPSSPWKKVEFSNNLTQKIIYSLAD